MLREFVSDLRHLPPLARSEAAMAGLMSAASAAGKPGIRLPFRAGHYTRTCVHRDDRFEVLLLDWAAGSVSPIHDHVAAVERTLTLHVYARPLDEFLVYDERSHRCTQARATYDARLCVLAEATA